MVKKIKCAPSGPLVKKQAKSPYNSLPVSFQLFIGKTIRNHRYAEHSPAHLKLKRIPNMQTAKTFRRHLYILIHAIAESHIDIIHLICFRCGDISPSDPSRPVTLLAETPLNDPLLHMRRLAVGTCEIQNIESRQQHSPRKSQIE